ncbi:MULTISPECIES: bifunctional phosphopantothenoylcysteine decarboxylase/phosphopantothenate--cysteine ligase CoaBC [Asaia]|uniref:bifunctional phosphopantothenoylcysteine decarboxylase/phosphopantothenate--cysteine ligase CoaBC n=1 Tax=Asaia TaxID=91914 RepID=UPI0025571E36|nr:bifunctional phosphopantothenoylcysteine decarboxylase/phosphopantothenate--cysteine ligase CoaBC [Asaia sp. HumB]MDL2172248.1 bifunctional phosphopantothenoylcysteine decarboxylase/phosphopantothenate--cysteine ligase CoaBC [Asaia sp. HumB]
MRARVILIIGGGIAAYKSLELIRLLRRSDIAVECVLTQSATHFVTPLAVQALSGAPVHTELLSLAEDSQMDHIALSRSADLIVVCPATANMLARMANGMADDLATTLLLATDTPVLVAPAMNVRMWQHPATQSNLATLHQHGCLFVGPDDGEMACGEFGPGRLSTPETIHAAIEAALFPHTLLAGRHVLVTAGPTHEPIDPVRFIANHSSGKQGYAVAEACARLGARVTLVSGPTNLPCPASVTRIDVQTAREMLAACEAALPADVAICAAAVGDWRMEDIATQKRKKISGQPQTLALVENPDILATLSATRPERPELIIGFAAETEHLEDNAISKRARKNCDWLLANNVGADHRIFGGDRNRILFLSDAAPEYWPEMTKRDVAAKLAALIADHFSSASR